MTPSRLLLIALTLWGLAMIVPDLLRVAQPLGSLGFFANNDGLIYETPDEIDKLLADETHEALKLASAASFRRAGPVFPCNGNGKGWEGSMATTIGDDEPMLAPVCDGKPFHLPETDGEGLDLPSGLSRPVLAVPVVNPVRCFAVSLYGPHVSGTDLDAYERGMLSRLAADAAAMYAELENGELRGQNAN